MTGLPNALTILRIVLVPVYAILFVLPGDLARITAFLVFATASISDWLDGFAARKLKTGSDFGPMADKVLIAVALMLLVAEGTFARFDPDTGNSTFSLLRLVPALIILAREILVSGLREFLAKTRVSVPVTAVAKVKTAVQMIAIGTMILTPLATKYFPGIPGKSYLAVAYFLLWGAAALTVYTGVIYFRNGMAYIKPGPSPAGD